MRAKLRKLSHTTNRNTIKIMLRKLLTPNIQRIESIRAIGAVLQQILLRFRILLCRLILSETIATTFHASRLHCKNKVIIILSVKVRHELLLPGTPLVNQQVLLIMSHWITQIHIIHRPTIAFKLMHHHPMKVLTIHRIVRAKSRSIIIVNHTVVRMRCIVRPRYEGLFTR